MSAKKYTQEVIKEGKRVRWPKKDVFIPALITTIAVCVLCAVILYLENAIGYKLIDALKEVFKGLKN